MKNHCLWSLLACIFFTSTSIGQRTAPLNQHPVDKTFLFAQLPEKFSIPAKALQSVFSASLNSAVNLALSDELHIEGLVTARCTVTPEQLSVNVRCSNYQNALLNLSRITNTNGSVSYIGRMISLQHGDVLLLWEENGAYSFIRQKLLLAMVE